MNSDAEINEFEDFFVDLGCPIECLPSRKAMTRIFASGQSLAFAKLMSRIQPMNECKAARERITINAINRIDGKILSKFTKQKLPEEMQRWMKMSKLNDRIKETKARLAETKGEYHKYAKLVKENNITKLQLNQMLESRAAKVAILKTKLVEIEEKIANEKAIGANVRKVMPVRIEQNNANDSAASAATAMAIAELQKYYGIDFDSNSYEVNASVRDKLWERLRDIFADIPNYLLWNCLFKEKETQLMTIDVMSKLNVNKMLEVDNVHGINKSSFKVAISKLYAKHIGLEIDRRSVGREKQRLLADYVIFYESFVVNLRAKYAMLNKDDIEDDFLDEYMQQFSTSTYSQSQIEFLQNAVDTLDAEIVRRNQMQQDHQLIGNSLRCIYEEIETNFYRMQEDMAALSGIRAKLEHNEGLLRYLVQSKNEQQTAGTAGGARFNANTTVSNSFNSSNDSVLGSTKLECPDMSMMSMRSDMVTSRPLPTLIVPQYLNELRTFLDIPIEKFKSQLSVQNQMELYGNPLVRTNAFQSIPKEMIEMIPYHLQTPSATLKQYQMDYDWLMQQRNQLTDLVIHEQIPTVDTEKLNKMKSEQMEQLAEISDKIHVICSKTTQILNDVGRFYKFLVDNPLEKFIPKSKLFNGRTYFDYEREFTMYYNMIEKQGAAV